MRRRFALGVLALVLAHLVHAFEAERRDVASRAGSSTWRRSQTKFGLSSSRSSSSAGVMPSSLASCARCARSASKSFGIAHSDGAGTLDGQHQPVAVDDAAAAGRQLQRARVAHLALLLEEVGADDLHVGGAAEQHAEAEADQRDEELRAPRRRLRREQRAGRIVDAARAGARAAPCAGALADLRPAHRATFMERLAAPQGAASRRCAVATYWVTAGVAVRIASLSRAAFSTRSCVACAWRSAFSRSNSLSSWRSLAAARGRARRTGAARRRTRARDRRCSTAARAAAGR